VRQFVVGMAVGFGLEVIFPVLMGTKIQMADTRITFN